MTGSVTCTGIRNLGGIADAPDELAALKPAAQHLHQLAGRRGVQHIDIDERDPGRGMAGPQPDVDAGPLRPRLDRLRIVRKRRASRAAATTLPSPTVPVPCLVHCLDLRSLVGGEADVRRGIVRQERQQAPPALVLQPEGDLAGRGHAQPSQ